MNSKHVREEHNKTADNVKFIW